MGTKTWRFKFARPDGREGLVTFGNYPALSLKAARECRSQSLRAVDSVNVLRRMEQHLFPVIGGRLVTDLKPRDLLVPLKAVER